jgi:hypothetical protein
MSQLYTNTVRNMTYVCSLQVSMALILWFSIGLVLSEVQSEMYKYLDDEVIRALRSIKMNWTSRW